MAKIPRKLQKIFGSNAGPQDIGKFGSLAAGAPSYTTDPDVIQDLSQFTGGWVSSILGNNSPAIQDRNALDYLMTYQLAYLLQQGVPEWDSATEYHTDSVVQSSGVLFKSIQNNNTNHLVSDGAWWEPAIVTSSIKDSAVTWPKIASGATANRTTRSVTSSDTPDTSDDLLLCSGASFTVTLPTAIGISGKVFEIMHQGTSATQIYTLATTSGQTVSGSASSAYKLAHTGDFVKVMSDGSNWIILDEQLSVIGSVRGSTTTVGTSATDIINPTSEFDPYGCYNTGTGVWTAPIPGTYEFSAMVGNNGHVSTTFAAASTIQVAMPITSTVDSYTNLSVLFGFGRAADNVNILEVQYSRRLRLAQSDTLKMTVLRSSDISSFALGANQNNFSWKRVGGL